MEDNQFRYKKKRPGFGNVQVGRVLREVAQQENRRKRRSALYNFGRGITASASPGPVVPAAETRTESQILEDDRRMKLLRWKAEKELKKKMQVQFRKPVFRAGVYHHKLNSPIYLHQVRPAAKPPKVKSPVRRITRATAKRLAAKAEAPTSVSVTRTAKHREVRKTLRGPSPKIPLETSFAPKNHQFKAPDGLPCVPLFGQAALTSSKKDSTNVSYFSPYVVIVRGKAAAQEEHLNQMETSITEYLPQEELINDTDSQSAKTCTEEVGSTPTYFRCMTENVISTLRAMCSLWEEVRSDTNVPEEAQLLINQTIGQTNLLIDKKFKQFKNLVSDCESGCGEKKVTCEDLQGFWDMVYMQVEDCNSRFDKLVKLKDRDWTEEQEEKPKKAKKVVVKKATSRRNNVSSKSSSVRDMIRAARKKKKESQDRNEDYESTEENSKENCDPRTPEHKKTRKSTRKSVRFTEDDCTACSELKPVYSMTPRVKRSSKKFRDKSETPKKNDRSRKTPAKSVGEDLIVFETPTKPPPRVRRSARLQRAEISN